MLKITKEDIEIMSTKLFQALIINAFRKEYGENWYENELIPHINSTSKSAAGETAKKYSDFISHKGAKASISDMDITLCSTILLYDDKYQEKIYPDSPKKNMLNELRNDRNKLFGHSGVLSDSMRITLFSRAIADLQLAVDTFDVASFDKQLAKDIQKLQESLFGSKISETSNDPLVLQYDEGEKQLSEGKNDYAFQIHNELAEMGFTPSMVRLAELFIKGTGTSQSFEKAEKWLEEAVKLGYQEALELIEKIKEYKRLQEDAKQGNSISMLKLGTWYESGELVSRDETKALEYYAQALSRGSFFAKSRIRAMAEEGNFQAFEYIYPQINDSLSFEEKKKVALRVIFDSGNPDEWERFAELISEDSELLFTLCLELYNDKSSGESIKKCFVLAQKGTELKYDKTMNIFGILYYHGIGVDKDQKKAGVLFEEAAALGNTAANCNIAPMYMNGTGMPVNLPKAFEHYKYAADHGNASAQFMLGEFYSKGLEGRSSSQKIVERDSKKAFEYYLAAANQGYKSAYLCLADYYNNEYSSLFNLAVALEWYAKSDCAEAYSKMCSIYERKEYNDPKKAFECCQKAASLGNNLEYDYKLAMYYYEGKGTRKNSILAIEHFLKYYKGHKDYNARSQVAYYLGMIYKNGDGIERDDMKAFNYFKEAAHYTNNVNALYELSKYARRDPKVFQCREDWDDRSHGLSFISCGRHHKTGEEMLKTCRDNGHLESLWEHYNERYYNDSVYPSYYNSILVKLSDENFLPAMEEMLNLYNDGEIDIPDNKLINLYMQVKSQGGRIYLDDRIAARLEALL